MCRKLIFLTSVVLLLALAGDSFAAYTVRWWVGEDSSRWDDINNWDPNTGMWPNHQDLTDGNLCYIPRGDLVGVNEPNWWPVIEDINSSSLKKISNLHNYSFS